MLRLARGGTCDLSFAEPFSRKRKADRSCLMELGEGKKNLYARILQNKNQPHNSPLIIS